VTFSGRVPHDATRNALTRALEALRVEGEPIIDLTESNPTRAGIPYPADILHALASDRSLRYDPHPLGLGSARAAVAADQLRRGARVDPDRVVLAASTSEAYSWLFKLLCNPGECVLTPRPSYPLFEHLTRLEGIRAEAYDLEYHGRWTIDFDAVARAPDDTRVVVVVSPNNPTGSYVKEDELRQLVKICRDRRWAIVADEVFADYALDANAPLTDIASRGDVLAFTLAGLSKTVGLPQLKLGWIVVGGPAADRDAALAALELVADSYLSVATPVQLAVPALLRSGASIRAAIQDRIGRNLRALRATARSFPACDLLCTEGGWSAVIRVPSTRSEERLVLDLLERERVLVHPGYFFDFPREAYLVVSLLPLEGTFADAVARVLRFVNA
jgi:aspartate/methionine/tyrosine aminotransferase